MYLKRKIDDFLHVWSRGKRLPLVLKGPRQVGKTESVRHFADGRYESIVEINFIEEPKYRKILDDGYGAQDIVNAISRINGSFRFPQCVVRCRTWLSTIQSSLQLEVMISYIGNRHLKPFLSIPH